MMMVLVSDGYETDVSKTQPNMFDSDNDGVSDGIEVCGTFDVNGFYSKTNDGKVEGVIDGINIDEKTTDFYDDTLQVTDPIKYQLWEKYVDSTGVHVKQISAQDSRCQTPADYNNDNVIDAKDAVNDSDQDGRTNLSEKDHGVDPLHSGTAYAKTELTDDVQADIDNKSYYPWITQTPDGEKMIAANFIYVPKSDSKGFWISKYEARYKDNDSNSGAVVFKRDVNDDGTNDSNVNDISIDTAKDLLSDEESQVASSYPLILTKRDQYTDLFNVKDRDGNTNCIIIKNSVGDTNMPVGAESEVCEITDANYEFTQVSYGKYKYDDGVTFSDSTTEASDTTFRGTSDYLQ